jgi:hypothetical protein
MKMHLESENAATRPVADAPSADFVRAVSDFLDTDPADLLHELGYYRRRDTEPPVPKADTISARPDKVATA